MRLAIRFWLSALAFVLALAPASAQALAIVEVRLERSSVEIGDTVRIDLYADLSRSVVGWGLDLGVDPNLLEPMGSPQIGTQWAPVTAADGDGLAGLRTTPLPAQNDVWLASVTFLGLAYGTALVFADMTPGDLAEGFALDPIGFDTVTLGTATIEVVPEPATGALVVLGVLASGLLRRSRE